MSADPRYPDGLPPGQIPDVALVRAGMPATVAVQVVVPWLNRAGVPGAPRDARILMALALGCSPGALGGRIRDPLEAAQASRFDRLIKRRLRREPVSQILGHRHFMTRTLKVSADVLDPRPETEVLIRLAQQEPFTRVLDLGVGSGAILCTLLADAHAQGVTGVGVDTSEEVCQIAFDNAQAFGVLERADIFISDWFEWVEGRFDLIVTNPPYISMAEFAELSPEVRLWEPRFALTDGGDGLGAYRRIAQDLTGYLVPGGRFLCEIGPKQAGAVGDILRAAGLAQIAVHRDLDGRDRVISARMPG